MLPSQGKFGARIFPMGNGKIYVVQTKKRGSADNSPYVIDTSLSQSGTFIDLSNDKLIADAVRSALAGTLAH